MDDHPLAGWGPTFCPRGLRAGGAAADLQSLGSGEQAGIGALRPALPKPLVLRVSLVRGMKDPLYSGRTCSK